MAVAAAALVIAVPAGPADPASAQLTAAVHRHDPWKTCRPRATLYTGHYRVDNDLFAGMEGPLCITAPDGHSFTIDTNLPGDGRRGHSGAVTAYPAIRLGTYFGVEDPGSGLPARVRAMPELLLRVRAAGSAGGTWVTDVDGWLYPPGDAQARGHGSAELVIATRWRGPESPYYNLIRVQGSVWKLYHWNTCSAATVPACWPITVFRVLHPIDAATIDVTAFLDAMVRAGYLSSSWYLGSGAFGTEIWSGGKGLSDSMTYSWRLTALEERSRKQRRW
jgi:Glycosyl hydrolase family 12